MTAERHEPGRNMSYRDGRVRELRHRIAEMTVQDHLDAAADAEANYPSSSDRAATWHLGVIKHLLWAQAKATGHYPRPADPATGR